MEQIQRQRALFFFNHLQTPDSSEKHPLPAKHREQAEITCHFHYSTQIYKKQ
jgi:hypothetical protein